MSCFRKKNFPFHETKTLFIIFFPLPLRRREQKSSKCDRERNFRPRTFVGQSSNSILRVFLFSPWR